MFRLVVLFAFFCCAFAGSINNELEGRIVNGEPTTIEEHPYQVSLQINGFHLCGGSIISPDMIVTAAHCLEKTEGLMVRLGSTTYNKGGILVPVEAHRIHELYSPITNQYDVGLVKLAFPVQESSTIRFIKLARKTPASGTTAVVTGWGSRCSFFCIFSPKILQEVEVAIVDKESCASEDFYYGNKIKDTMFCAYGEGKDSCQGDSGGPLVANSALVGIVSWGISCGRVGFPGVYCNVGDVRGWIERNAKTLT